VFKKRVSYTLGDAAFLPPSPIKVHRRRGLSLGAGRELIGDVSFQPASPICQRRRIGTQRLLMMSPLDAFLRSTSSDVHVHALFFVFSW